jgi:Domain of unknown function (DUF4352)
MAFAYNRAAMTDNTDRKPQGRLWAVLGCIALLLLYALYGRDEKESQRIKPPINSNAAPNPPAAPALNPQAVEPEVKTIRMGKPLDFSGLLLQLTKVQVERERVVVDMVIKNNTNQKINFYPNQGNVVIGTLQLETSYSRSASDLSGDIYPKVEKSGSIIFTIPAGKTLSPRSVKKLEFHFGKQYDEEYKSGEVSLTLPVS